MFGKNKIMKPEIHSGERLDIQEIFPTLQGEGPYVGHPSIFIRLGGCNLACDFCDTEFDSYKNFSLQEIFEQVINLSKNSSNKIVRNLVVITGGEPMRQPIEKLCDGLIKLGFLVQIETNGTLYRELPMQVKIICSPKMSSGKYHQIRPDLMPKISAFKFIIRAPREGNSSYSKVLDVGQSKFGADVYLQAMDEYDEVKNRENLEYAVRMCLDEGYLLSLQAHKILQIK